MHLEPHILKPLGTRVIILGTFLHWFACGWSHSTQTHKHITDTDTHNNYDYAYTSDTHAMQYTCHNVVIVSMLDHHYIKVYWKEPEQLFTHTCTT